MNVTQVPGIVEYIYIVHLKLEIRNNTLTRVLFTVVQTASAHLISLTTLKLKTEYF